MAPGGVTIGGKRSLVLGAAVDVIEDHRRQGSRRRSQTPVGARRSLRKAIVDTHETIAIAVPDAPMPNDVPVAS